MPGSPLPPAPDNQADEAERGEDEAGGTVFAKLAPMAHYLRNLDCRMRHECFPADDELFKVVEQASAAMHRLAIHTHYASCEKVMQKPSRNDGSFSR